eukprot:TRINITY_DN11108_c0_g1_i1.p1 TRINITY_DN11108_c0_g1~~TRINITY_DN11108_c0_g1_i1.p1  ORF type:complete len:135 (-),score=2.40 TRINITY_DN11108_c0_g1_i1:112-516(-)
MSIVRIILVVLALTVVGGAAADFYEQCAPRKCKSKCCTAYGTCSLGGDDCKVRQCLSSDDCEFGCCDTISGRCLPDSKCTLLIRTFGSDSLGFLVIATIVGFTILAAVIILSRLVYKRFSRPPAANNLLDNLKA